MKLVYLFLLFFAPLTLLAQQNSNFHFKKLQVTEGLSENTTFSIFQDQDGFMWFGTKDGLNRYDGSSFKVYRNQSKKSGTIGNNFIRSIAQGDRKTLYVGTDAGLYLMDRMSESFSKIDTKASDHSIINSGVNALFIDKRGILWIATMGNGFYQYDPKKAILIKIAIVNNPDPGAAWCILEDKSGVIWAGTRKGLLRFNAQSRQLEPVHTIFNKDNSDHEVLSMLEDQLGNLWLGTWAKGMRCYNKQLDSFSTYLNENTNYVTHIRAVFQYTDQQLLVGSDDGIYLFNTDTHRSSRIDNPKLKHSLSDQSVYSIAKDREGGIWIGTYFGGVNYLNPRLASLDFHYADDQKGFLSGKAVSQFCEEASGNIWIATEDGGLNYYNVITKQLSQPVKTSYHNTHALLLDGDNLWIGTFSRGIDVYNTKTKKTTNYRFKFGENSTVNDDCIFSLCKTKSGDIFIGTPVGLNKFDRIKKTFVRVAGINSFIYDIKEDGFGDIWLASYSAGAIKFDVKKQQWIHYDQIKKNEPIVGAKLTGIYIDSRRRLLFSSEGRGIFTYNRKTDSFKNISEAEGLPNNVIYGILDDADGNLWLSSNKGLICVNTEQPSKFRLYNIENGLQSNQFNYKASYKAKDGKFYFGGINGFNSFYPQQLTGLKNQIIPPVVITSLKLLDDSNEALDHQIQTSLNTRKSIQLDHNNSSFTISFVSLSYISQTNNQYAYKLDGADDKWTSAGNNKNVTYVNLPPGKYTFSVKASNNDGLWNERGTSITIEILPPFWLSIYAKIFYLVAALLTCYLLVQYYLNLNKTKHARQLAIYRTEQETKSFQSKIDFFTTIAHEIRTPLSLISAPLEEIVSQGDGNFQTKSNLSIIEKNTDRLKILINQLLDFRKMDAAEYKLHPEEIDLKSFLTELHERFKKTAQNNKIQFDLRLPKEKNQLVSSDLDALTKIVSNLLTNAIKFTDDHIVLSLKHRDNGSHLIRVTDNGKGIPEHYKTLIFDPFYQIKSDQNNVGTGIGLSLVKHLSTLLKGQIVVENGAKSGAIFSFAFTDIEKSEPANIIPNQSGMTDNQPNFHGVPITHSVLVVDDNPDITTFMSNCLAGDYLVDTAEDATTALKSLDKTNYNLIISDIMMPGIDGISFVKKIKADLRYSHIPVILLSAKIENATKAEGLLSGAEVFMEKPFSPIHLKAQIASLLKNRKSILESFNSAPLAPYSSLTTNKNDEAFIQRLNEEIEKHIGDENLNIESLVDILNISRSNLQRKLKVISGHSPGDYLRNYRLKRACLLLLEPNVRINEVAFNVGFSSASYFTKAFIKCYNMSPKEFINKHITKSDKQIAKDQTTY